MTLEKENGPANLSGRDVIVWGTRNANRQRKGSLRAQRNLSAVGKILSASEMTGPKTFRKGTLCSSRDGDRRNGGDGGVTKEEKRDAEKTRTPGGGGEGVLNAFVLVCRLSRILVW